MSDQIVVSDRNSASQADSASDFGLERWPEGQMRLDAEPFALNGSMDEPPDRRSSTVVLRSLTRGDAGLCSILDGSAVQNVVDQIADFFCAPLLVRDVDGSPIATSGRFPEVETKALTNVTSLAWKAHDPVYADRIWAAPMRAGGERIGDVLLIAGADLNETRTRLFGWFAQVVALLLFMHQNIMETETRLRRELLDDLLTGPPHPARLRERACRIGVDPDLSYVLLLVRPDTRLDHAGTEWITTYADRHSGLCTEHDGNAVLLVHGDDPGAAARHVAEQLPPVIGDPVTVGAAGPSAGIDSIPALVREAQRCVDALLMLGRSGSGAGAQELGFIGMLIADTPNISHYVHDMLGTIMTHDARRGSKLLETLDAYFASGGSPRHAAKSLHVHVNTVARRLERISRMLGKNWREPERALELQVALRLHRLRHTL